MKFKINRNHFSNGLQHVLNIVSTRPTLPILSNVFIKAEKDSIFLTTTNLDLGIRCGIQAEIEESGDVTLPVRKLAMIIRELPHVDVSIDTDSEHQARIQSGGSRFRIMGMSTEEFPPLSDFKDQYHFVLPQDTLRRMLHSVSYAQSTDEGRHMLNSVFFKFEPGKLTLAATDGRRLALIKEGLDKLDQAQSGSLILPAKTVVELERLLGKGDNVDIVFNERQVAFTLNVDDENDTKGVVKGGIYLVSKVVEGKYPDYNQVIPKQTESRIKVERELLLECVSRAALVTSDKDNSISFNIKKDALEISALSTEYGEAHESMAIQYQGENVTLAFNPAFIIDPLRALTHDEMIFEFKDDLSPGVFRTDGEFLCVIMPLRL